MFSRLNVVLIVILVILWGTAAWLWRYQDRPDQLNERLPLISKFRRNRLHPLFGSRGDVLGLAGWLFGIGLLILGLMLVQTTKAIIDNQRAQHVLVDFLQSLYEGKYEKAARLYGGTYEGMIDNNPGLDPNDHIALLKNACTINGVKCLPVKSVILDEKVSNAEFTFKVEFLNADGTLFVRGPCCGGSETDFPPESVFYFTVMKLDKDRFIVLDMPPYVP